MKINLIIYLVIIYTDKKFKYFNTHMWTGDILSDNIKFSFKKITRVC